MVYKISNIFVWIIISLMIIPCSVLAIDHSIIFPPDGYYTQSDQIVLKAEVYGADTAVINGKESKIKRGKLYHRVFLKDGANNIKITYKGDGEEASDKIVVNRGLPPVKKTEGNEKLQKDSDKSVSYKFYFPPQNPFETVNDQILIKADVNNVETVLINGKDIPINSGRIFVKIPLNEGENVFDIQFINKEKTLSETYHVVRKKSPGNKNYVPIYYNVLYPPENYETDKDLVLVKLSTKGVDHVLINGEKADIKGGRVFYKTKINGQGNISIPVRLANANNMKEFFINVLKTGENYSEEDNSVVDNISPEEEKNFILDEDNSAEKANESIEKSVVSEEYNVKEDILTSVRQEIEANKKSIIEDVTSIMEKSEQQDILSRQDSFQEEVADMFEQVQVKLSLLFKRLKDVEDTAEKTKFTDISGISNGETITIKLRDANIKDVVEILAKKANINIVADQTLKGKVTVDLKDVDLNTALNLVLKSHGYTYAMIDNTLVVGDADKINTKTTLQSKVFRLSQAKAKNVIKAVEPFVEEPEKIAVAEEENSIIAYASPSTLKKIEKTISELDKRNTRQVFIEAKIIEVGTNVLDKIGVNWNGSTQVSWIDNDEDSSSDSSDEEGSSSDSSGIDKKITVSDAEVIINYIKTSGESKILATPKMSAINGKEAQIHVGDRYPYITTEIDSKTGEMEKEVNFIDTGTKLSITPFINDAADTIKLSIKIEVSFIFGFAGENNEIPWVRTREAESTIIVQNGKSAVIGGLINNENTTSETSVPVLGDLPIIGNLFKGNTTEMKETELIIAITPTILDHKF